MIDRGPAASFQIRQVVPSDIVEWRAFRAEGLQQHPEAFLTTTAEDAARSDQDIAASLDRQTVLGLWQGDRLLGSVTLVAENHPRMAHRVWLSGVYVRTQARGRGLARQLIQAAVDWARANGHLQVELYHAADNAPAAKTYAALGFRDIGRVPRAVRYLDGFQDDIHLILYLDDQTT